MVPKGEPLCLLRTNYGSKKVVIALENGDLMEKILNTELMKIPQINCDLNENSENSGFRAMASCLNTIATLTMDNKVQIRKRDLVVYQRIDFDSHVTSIVLINDDTTRLICLNSGLTARGKLFHIL